MRDLDHSLGFAMKPKGTILLFGGVTLEGYESAERLARSWTARDVGVIWFDGYAGNKPSPPRIEGLLVIDYGARERNRRLNRLEGKTPEAIAGIGRSAADSSMESRATRSRGRGVGDLLATIADRFSIKWLRRWNTATRSYANWRLIRKDVKSLADRLTPREVIYCDDDAFTAAWHAARLWSTTPVGRAPAA